MTIRDAFDTEMDEITVSDRLAKKILADNGLLETADYDATLHAKPVDISVAQALSKVVARPSISEGGYSIKWDAAALRARIASIYKKWDMEDPLSPKPTVRSVSPW